MSIVVTSPGLLTTVQDGGRIGFRGIGVGMSGPVDHHAMQTANLLVGNHPSAAALEVTLTGGAFLFEKDTLVALCGAKMDAYADNGLPMPTGRPVLVRAGTELRLGVALSGFRAYLAVAGGIVVPTVMASSSTLLRARLGGFAGRALIGGDQLPIGVPNERAVALASRLASTSSEALVPARWGIAPMRSRLYAPSVTLPTHANGARVLLPLASYRSHPEVATIRAVRGREADAFEPTSMQRFFSEPFEVTSRSDRMGCRLSGPRLSLSVPMEMISEAVVPGTVQVPAGGSPIVLLADAQTTGGYPRIAHIAEVDVTILAQKRPGEWVQFVEISLLEAQALSVMRTIELQRIQVAIQLRMLEDD